MGEEVFNAVIDLREGEGLQHRPREVLISAGPGGRRVKAEGRSRSRDPDVDMLVKYPVYFLYLTFTKETNSLLYDLQPTSSPCISELRGDVKKLQISQFESLLGLIHGLKAEG